MSLSPEHTDSQGNAVEAEEISPGCAEGQSIVAEICEDLAAKGDVLNKEIEDMKTLEGSCMKALEQLHLEQAAWYEKLQSIKTRISQIEKRKDETDLLLDLHQVLRSSGSLELALEAAQHVVSAEVEDDEKAGLYTPCEAETGKCTICSDEISPEEMLARLRTHYKTHPNERMAVCKKCSLLPDQEGTANQ